MVSRTTDAIGKVQSVGLRTACYLQIKLKGIQAKNSNEQISTGFKKSVRKGGKTSPGILQLRRSSLGVAAQ